MTKNDIKAIIAATAARRGFTAEQRRQLRVGEQSLPILVQMPNAHGRGIDQGSVTCLARGDRCFPRLELADIE